MTRQDNSWFDDAAGPLIRPYAITRGRTMGAAHDLDVATLVTTSGLTHRPRPEQEYESIIAVCQVPLSVAEVAASLRLPLAVTKILVGDLIGEGHLIFRAPVHTEAGAGDLNILRAVLDGIRRL
ncbi:DUF742 domain-containing protein [Nocardia sp. NPDC058176]|uniref:DUF742 domain-containing protein n=1 Tax=Nocardia sp. NPDC058176 TaxID=3346368 RepID=UPI0036DDABD3